MIVICVFVSKIWPMPYFVAKFTNMAREAKMLEKLRPDANFFFMSACNNLHYFQSERGFMT